LASAIAVLKLTLRFLRAGVVAPMISLGNGHGKTHRLADFLARGKI
jgi:hypothetical protein